MDDEVEWLTYPDLAERLGIGVDSAKNLVRRKRWQRRAGNDGLARIGVPLSHLAEHTRKTDGGIDAPNDGTIEPPIDASIDGRPDGASAVAIAALERHVDRLESELAAAVAERDTERARGAQVEALRAVLDIERQRVADAQADAERWRSTATAPRGLLAWIGQARAALKG